MPAIITYILGSVFLLLFSAIGYVLYVDSRKEREYVKKIHDVQEELLAAQELANAQATTIKTLQHSISYDENAGRILSQLHIGVILVDQQKIVRLINPYARRFLDLAADVGMPIPSAVRLLRGTTEGDFSLIDAALAGTTTPILDGVALICQRGTFPIRGSIFPLTKGTLVEGAVIAFEDSSDDVARVKEEQAFFSAAAHELRTPLTVIRMTVSLLKDKFETLPKEKIIEHLRRTDETSEKLVRLVNEFLNISRLDQGRMEIVPTPFDMVTLTDTVITDLSLLAKEKHLFVTHDIDVAQRMVMADQSKTAEILTNIISNALKYTVRGGITIKHQLEESSMLTIVTDTGSGIPKEAQGVLFSRFGQVGYARTQTAAKSTGLGLYIAKKMANLMHGDVVLVSSEPGVGSTFGLRIPLR